MGWGARDGGPCTPSGPLTASPAAGGPAGAEPGSGDGCLGFWLHRRGLPRRRKRRRKRRPGNRPRATGAKRRGSACRVTMPTPPGGGGHYEEGRCQLEAKRRQPGWSQLRPTSANKLARVGENRTQVGRRKLDQLVQLVPTSWVRRSWLQPGWRLERGLAGVGG